MNKFILPFFDYDTDTLLEEQLKGTWDLDRSLKYMEPMDEHKSTGNWSGFMSPEEETSADEKEYLVSFVGSDGTILNKERIKRASACMDNKWENSPLKKFIDEAYSIGVQGYFDEESAGEVDSELYSHSVDISKASRLRELDIGCSENSVNGGWQGFMSDEDNTVSEGIDIRGSPVLQSIHASGYWVRSPSAGTGSFREISTDGKLTNIGILPGFVI